MGRLGEWEQMMWRRYYVAQITALAKVQTAVRQKSLA
jgi:hypothetical protein